MKKNPFKNFFTPGPRGRLRWGIFAVVVVFLISFFLDFLGFGNVLATQADRLLTATPVIKDLSIWPVVQVSTTDGSKNINFENIQQIDLNNYGPNFKLGLDLLGGAHLVYDADVSNIPSADKASAVAGVRDVIERRINALGVSEPVVQTNQVGDNWRVIVELAGVYDINQAIKIIGETPLLEFKEENPNAGISADNQAKIDKANEAVQKTAQGVLNKILKGADFAALAKQYSEDPGSKDNGGLYTAVKKGDFVAEYDAVIFGDLAVGKVYPELVKSSFGYHIIKKDAENGTGDTRTIDTRHILFKIKTATDLGIAVEPEWKVTNLTGKQLKKARVDTNPNSGVPEVSLEFNSEGTNLFADITKRNTGKLVAIFLDNYPISIPKVNEPILSGQAVISGGFSLQEAKLLAQRLNAGALPVPINLVSQSTVGASLGNESVAKSLQAGFYGLILVIAFMILYYRLPGLISVIALIIYIALSLTIFKLVPVTLTLAGIAGFILSVGMAVDANVLIFERMKEELRDGRDLSSAINEGFKRAWLSIRDSNVSSLLTCAILFWFGTSIIRGFALTLSIGIILSMLSAITISKTFLQLIAKWKISKSGWLYGVKNK